MSRKFLMALIFDLPKDLCNPDSMFSDDDALPSMTYIIPSLCLYTHLYYGIPYLPKIVSCHSINPTICIYTTHLSQEQSQWPKIWHYYKDFASTWCRSWVKAGLIPLPVSKVMSWNSKLRHMLGYEETFPNSEELIVFNSLPFCMLKADSRKKTMLIMSGSCSTQCDQY